MRRLKLLCTLAAVAMALTFTIPAAAGDCRADLNLDGVVDVFDLLELLGDWGSCGVCELCRSDLTDTCEVNVLDLIVLLESWGPCADPPGACEGYCGGISPTGCPCDELCFFFSDCCPGTCVDCPELSFCE